MLNEYAVIGSLLLKRSYSEEQQTPQAKIRNLIHYWYVSLNFVWRRVCFKYIYGYKAPKEYKTLFLLFFSFSKGSFKF